MVSPCKSSAKASPLSALTTEDSSYQVLRMRCPAQLLVLLVLWIPGKEREKDEGKYRVMGISVFLSMSIYILSRYDITSVVL